MNYSRLAPTLVASLQRAAGNGAVSRLLGYSGSAKSRGGVPANEPAPVRVASGGQPGMSAHAHAGVVQRFTGELPGNLLTGHSYTIEGTASEGREP